MASVLELGNYQLHLVMEPVVKNILPESESEQMTTNREKPQEYLEDIADIDNHALTLKEIEALASQPERLIHALKRRPDTLYSEIFLSLVNESIGNDEAKKMWHGVLEHMATLEGILGRPVGITMATLDYFHSIKKLLISPKIIEEAKLLLLAKTSTKDELTQLYTRDLFDIVIEKEVQESTRKSKPLSLLILDIDNFKAINDDFGHQKGDEILARIGDVINGSIRKMDFAARYGGEELVVIMPNTPISSAEKIAERIRCNVAELIDDQVKVTISGGVSALQKGGQSSKILISEADTALYDAKELGKNKIMIFSE